MTEVTTDELIPAMMSAIERLAPTGGPRSVPINTFGDALTEMLATLLVMGASLENVTADVDALTELFHDKLLAAVATHQVGHA